MMPKTTYYLLQSIFEKHQNINEVILYGSRAKGTHHERSDMNYEF